MAEPKVLLVRLAKDLYAIPIASIEEILPALPIEAMPQSPEYVRGVVFVRGHLIPVLSAAERLGLRDHQSSDDPPVICVRVGKRMVGIEFDEAVDLMDIEGAKALGCEEIGVQEGFFTGVVECNGLVIRMLNPEYLISPDETPISTGFEQE
ncbi:MAG TPA: chemotaxis protein CheW [Gemmataceae bacterium]|nr:chemotaxis protein CheW [Gemmataceae bacterium]